MFRYQTVEKEAQAEQVIEKSRFIAHVCRVGTREEAEAFIARIRAMHRSATHNVPAYVIGEKFELQWCSDDGEPQGTAGAPVLQMLVKEGMTNVALVVTRYFGGVKLGTGGLVRAYTGSAKLALEAAGMHRVWEKDFLTVQLAYPFLGKLQNLEKEGRFSIVGTEFTDAVTLTLSCQPEETEQIMELLSNLTGGTFDLLTKRQETE